MFTKLISSILSIALAVLGLRNAIANPENVWLWSFVCVSFTICAVFEICSISNNGK